MYTDEDLDSAVAAGAVAPEAAAALRAHVAAQRATPAVDEENFRLITGFNDVFVVIACALLLASVGWIAGGVAPWLGLAGVAAVAWLLAEFFVRRRRMALPAIVLLLAFGGCVFGAVRLLLGEAGWVPASAAAALALWLHWLRFQVPITVACGAAALVALACTLVLAVLPAPQQEWLSAVALAAGLAVFAVALYWDAGDTLRRTRRSDVAFWLHLLAAPLLVHPVFAFLRVEGGQAGAASALAVLGMYVLLALVSLAIDRRALMVSALFYVLYSFSALFKAFGVVSLGYALTAFVIGSALLLLSAFWHPARGFVVRLLPPGWRARVPPLRV